MTRRKVLSVVLTLCALCVLFSYAGCGDSPASTESGVITDPSGSSDPSSSVDPSSIDPTTTTEEVPWDPSFLKTDCEAFCVLSEDGTPVLSRNSDEPYRPASITKVLTALIVCERVPLTDVVTVLESDLSYGIGIMSSGVTPSLKPGEEMTVEDLLYALIVPSTNAAGNVLARYTAGSIEAFVDLMNQKLEELDLYCSHFANPHGFDMDGHETAAYDMAVIFKAAMDNPLCAPILGAGHHTIPATAYSEERSFYASDRFISGDFYLDGVIGGKSGYTDNAKSTLLTAVERNGVRYYIATLHSDEALHYIDTANIVTYLYSQNPKEAVYTPLVHNLTLDLEDWTGVTLSYTVDYPVTGGQLIYWDKRKGVESAVYTPLPSEKLQGRSTIRIEFPEEGLYHVQIAVTDRNGNTQYGQVVILYDMQYNDPGIAKWRNASYFINERGFVEEVSVSSSIGAYYMSNTCEILTGFVGGRFFAGEDGKIVTGWINYGNERFYAQPDGRLAKGLLIINNQLYHFNENGRLIENGME